MQPIGAYMLQKIQAAKCLAVSVYVLLQPPTCLLYIPHVLTIFASFIWGVILFLHVVCNSWGKLMAVRFFLGMAEGV